MSRLARAEAAESAAFDANRDKLTGSISRLETKLATLQADIAANASVLETRARSPGRSPYSATRRSTLFMSKEGGGGR